MQPQNSSHPLLQADLRPVIEQKASAHWGQEWQVKTFEDLVDLASHPCAILSNGTKAIFVKLSTAANGLDQFQLELAGLQYLALQAGVLIPSPIGIVAMEKQVLLMLEAAPTIERDALQWRQIGQTLARIHQVKGNFCGFNQQGYFGPLYQDNRPTSDWLTFYVERRLWPRLMGAIESGHLPTQAIRQVEQLIFRIPQLDIPEVVPVLLHGDAQQNNFISTPHGAMVIDPAIHFGNPEMDLAYIDYFQAVPEAVFQGYQDVLPIAPGFHDRKELWRVSAYLAAVTVEGPVHLDKLTRAVKAYL